jgi:hypothetical protein
VLVQCIKAAVTWCELALARPHWKRSTTVIWQPALAAVRLSYGSLHLLQRILQLNRVQSRGSKLPAPARKRTLPCDRIYLSKVIVATRHPQDTLTVCCGTRQPSVNNSDTTHVKFRQAIQCKITNHAAQHSNRSITALLYDPLHLINRRQSKRTSTLHCRVCLRPPQ